MKLVCSICLFAALSAAAFAPSLHAQTPQWEIFGGASYFHASAGSGSIMLPDGTKEALQQNAYGWHGSIAENKTSWFGGVMDFGGYYANRTVEGVQLNGSAYPFLFGPQFSKHGSRLSLFAHPLIGGVHIRGNYSGGTSPLSETKWALALGGGADFRISDHLAIRGQGDWIRSHFAETLTKDSQDNFAVTAGLVLTLGEVGVR